MVFHGDEVLVVVPGSQDACCVQPRTYIRCSGGALLDLHALNKAVYTASSGRKNDQGSHQLAGTSRFSPEASVSVTRRSLYSLPECSDYGTHPLDSQDGRQLSQPGPFSVFKIWAH
jgi:hypothetical protein